MARTSKKVAKNAEAGKEIPADEKIYKTAIYARISNEDLSMGVGGTIENQTAITQKYIEDKPYLKLCGTYIDNGQTGTNFNREGFQNLIEAIKRGKINCIVVKDLSRFGRDYIETGNYLEKVFPFLGVRFISVNDNYDSHNLSKNKNNLSVILKNLINDIYAKDLSKKIKSALEIKQKKGEYIGGNAPYGYIKSPENKHKLVINEDTAPIVKKIYQWKIDGMNDTDIIRNLENLQVPSPSNYLYSKGLLYNEKFSKKSFWSKKTINAILSNPVYIGNCVQGKEKSRFDAGLKSERLSEDKWIIVENTHEPIIETEIFYAVKNMLNKRNAVHHELRKKNEPKENRENIFLGFVKCADCGRSLIRKDTTTADKLYYYFGCPRYSNYLSDGCTRKFISEIKLKKAVFISIKQQLSILLDTETKIKRIKSSPQTKNKEWSLREELQSIKQNQIKLNSFRNSLYDDFKDGLLNDKEYSFTRQKYETDGNILAARLNEISAELEEYANKAITVNIYFDEARRFNETEELTKEMLTTFIEKITVYGDKRIEIIFRFQDEFEQLLQHFEEKEAIV